MLETGWLPLAADGVVAVLLIVTIAYVARLNARLAALRADRETLAQMIAGLRTASEQAEAAVGGLRLSATESGRDLAGMIERGTALREDLAFLVGKAEPIADRLQAGLRQRKDGMPAAVSVSEGAEPGDPRTAQSRLASLLRQTAAGDRHNDRKEPALRVAAALPDAVGDAEPAPGTKPPRQSRSERDLQRALLGRH